MVKFIRQMSFRETFMAEFVGKILASTTAIALVYLGGGYWAIAASSITSSVATTLISYLLAPYRPALSLINLSDFSTFLGWFSSEQVVSALSWQFDRAIRSGTVYDGKRSVRLAHAEFDRSGNAAGYGGVLENY
jgi:PST family polysaccharide transporter